MASLLLAGAASIAGALRYHARRPLAESQPC